MAGKKRRAKAEKSGVRYFDLSRTMWQMLANVSLMADTLGAAPSIVEGCRVLSARAEYYLGEPENARGLVRGELSCAEWDAFQKLVEEFSDASPSLNALAQTIAECGTEQTMTVEKMSSLEDQDEQAQHDAEMISSPESLESILAALDFMVLHSEEMRSSMPKEVEQSLMEMSGVTIQEMWKDTMGNVRSARKKLKRLQEDMLKCDGCATAHLMMSTQEARVVSGMLWLFKEGVQTKIEVPPEHAEEMEEVDEVLESAVRFFARVGDATDLLEEEDFS